MFLPAAGLSCKRISPFLEFSESKHNCSHPNVAFDKFIETILSHRFELFDYRYKRLIDKFFHLPKQNWVASKSQLLEDVARRLRVVSLGFLERSNFADVRPKWLKFLQ